MADPEVDPFDYPSSLDDTFFSPNPEWERE